MKDFNRINELAMWMVECIGKNKELVLRSRQGADWDWVASEVWRSFPGIVDEFLINNSIDFLLEAAEIDE